MTITVYSFIMAIMWFTTFVVIAEILRRKTGFLSQYNIGSMLFLVAICAVRICIPIETPMTIVINSDTIFVTIQLFLMQTVHIANTELSLLTLLLAIWVIGASVQLVRFVSHLRKDSQTVRALILSKHEDAEVERVTHILNGIVMQTPTYERYQMVMSPQIPTPMVTGFFIQKILLPKTASELSDENLYYVLMHEWYHLLNRDVWIKCLVELLCCLMWWNPVVYLLKNSVEQALEIKCDLSVTRHMNSVEKANYLQTILFFVETCSSKKMNVPECSVKFLGLAENFEIRQRFHIVGKYQGINQTKSAMFVVAMSLLLILSYSFVIQPHTPLPIDDVKGMYSITPENAYILALDDGTFELFVDDEFFVTIPEGELSAHPHNLLSTIYE